MSIKLKDTVKPRFAEKLDTFYVNNVILPFEKIKELHEKKDLNLNRLYDGLEEYNKEHNTEYKIEEIVLQGSVAMGTSVSADEKNYDIDVAIIMNKNNLPEGTLASKKIISESLKKKCYNMKNEPDPTGNSITIEYEEGYHLDFALYGKENDRYYHCGSIEWDERNPKAISWWFNTNNQNSNDLLRKIVKYIKFFSKQNSDWLMPGGLIISVLVNEALKTVNLNNTIDVILKNVVNSIIDRLEINKEVLNPCDESKNLIKKEKDVKKLDNLYSRLKSKITKANELKNDSSEEDINDAWNYFFGADYFTKDFDLKKVQCEDNEENIENYFDINYNSNVNKIITCQLSSKEGNTNGRTLRNYESDTELSVSRYKDEKLIFTANNISIGNDIVLWKIRNNGKNAIKANALRGNIVYSNRLEDFDYNDIYGNKRCENISFPGHHYVDCYIIINNEVIYRERFKVNLVD